MRISELTLASSLYLLDHSSNYKRKELGLGRFKGPFLLGREGGKEGEKSKEKRYDSLDKKQRKFLPTGLGSPF